MFIASEMLLQKPCGTLHIIDIKGKAAWEYSTDPKMHQLCAKYDAWYSRRAILFTQKGSSVSCVIQKVPQVIFREITEFL